MDTRRPEQRLASTEPGNL
ncbi:hypothetical protein GQ600_8865 [Phytophthora cactorum]|nr:hypothetical protein GQ600_8865 [Phytophthora cactorum]